MSLFGSLYSGVSGLRAQGTNIGVISDNISNMTTVGYKAGETNFSTLVNNAPTSVSYNPGGVLASVRQLNDRQGLLQATDSPTDIAISGGGFFVVNPRPDSQASDSPMLFTRAGSFRQDATGNFVNTSGFFLQGWPLDRDGRLPGEPGNTNTNAFSTLASLETVNIENTNGVVASTTSVEIGANLDATQTILRGAGETVSFQTTTINQGISGEQIIAPDAVTLVQGTVLTVNTGNGLTYDFEYGGISTSSNTAAVDMTADGGNNVATTTETFFTLASPPPTGADATFTVQTTSMATPVTFTYTQSSPNIFNNEFNNMETLVAAVNEVSGLTARIDDTAGGGNEVMMFAPDDADDTLTFADGGAVGWLAGLGLANTAISVSGAPRFATLSDLADKIDASDGLTTTLENPLGNAELSIFTEDPLETISFYDSTAVAPGPYAFIDELGLNNGDGGSVYDYTQIYDAADTTKNMTSGEITPQFSRNIRIFDSLGTGHNLTISFVKIATNQWAAEIYAADADEVNGSLPGGNSQLASGTLTFNGDGTLRAVSTGLLNEVDIAWTNGAIASSVSFDWGTAGQPNGTEGADIIGLSDGFSQFASDYNVAFVDQNGADVGSLVSVNIDEEGFVIANYSNGESQSLYKLPIAEFASPINLENRSGNVWFDTQDAGEVNLREAGTNDVVSGVLESSNVELAEELTDMIVAQRAYQSSSKVISTTDELLEELTRL